MSNTAKYFPARPKASLAAMWVLALIVVCPSCAPNVRILKHDPNTAAREAEKFAGLAFVERDFQRTHAMLSPNMQKEYSPEKLETEIVKVHPSGYPTSIAAAEFEPIPGQAAINIFLTGEGDSQKSYYRIFMVGTVDSGYSVGGFWRGSGPYPPSKMRKALPK